MNLRDLTSRPGAIDLRSKFYRSFISWFKRANLIGTWVNYEQDIDLLIKNFATDLVRFEAHERALGPPGSSAELYNFLLWQLPQYSSFDEEGTKSRQLLVKVLDQIIRLKAEDVLAVLSPIGKSSYEQLCRDCKKYHQSQRHSDVL